VLLLTPALAELTDRQSRFFFLFQSIVARQPSDPLRPLVDSDVVDCRVEPRALARERVARRDLRAASAVASGAGSRLRVPQGVRGRWPRKLQGPRTPLERDAAKAFDALAEAARRVGPLAGDSRSGFIELARRILKPSGEQPANDAPGDRGPGSLIIP
jgi:hypothetical protein